MSPSKRVTAVVESMTIPTYVPPAPEELPMYSEFRQHQGSTGYAYPNRVTTRVEREKLTDREYQVVRLENDYVRLIIIPEIGGRVFEGFDKTTGYHFLYRHTRIKPVLVGTYGSWISGGLEFNFPHHHRPSTHMPVDFAIERCEDGSVVCWLSECAPAAGQFRIKGMVGIALRPDASYFETKVQITNRTSVEHPFMWWENAGIHVNESYQVFFPQDVTYAHHHSDRHHATWPLHKGWYAVEEHVDVTDLSVHSNTIKGNSYFAGPSRYDFFGGYDHEKDSGTVHVGDHHITPGKKHFSWALETLGDAWNSKLTDTDGEHAELMAGSFSDDQPDFTWIAPYETKVFSQFWYPIHAIKAPVFANLEGAVSVDRAAGVVRLGVTRPLEGGRLRVFDGETLVSEESVSLEPSGAVGLTVTLSEQLYRIELESPDGTLLMTYTEERPEKVLLPKDNTGIPTPRRLTTAQQIAIAGRHVDQYRDPSWTGAEYYQVALERDPEFIPALVGLAQHDLDKHFFDRALRHLDRAKAVQNAFNPNPSDGTVDYLRGLALLGLRKDDEAYDALFKAAWSANAIPAAMAFVAAIDGRRGEFDLMLAHARTAVEHDVHHPIAVPLSAVAQWKLGDSDAALRTLDAFLQFDRLNHLARFLRFHIAGADLADFFDPQAMNSNPSQTALDVALDLCDSGLHREAATLLKGLERQRGASAMALYVLAAIQDATGDPAAAGGTRELARTRREIDVFPYRLGEWEALEAALRADAGDVLASYLHGCILYDKQHYENAAKAWERTVALDAEFYAPLRNLAIVYYSKLGRRADARALLDRALTLKPKDDTLLKEAAFVMARLGVSGPERLEYLLKHMPSSPSDNLTLDLANAYIAAGELDTAVKTLESHSFVPAECTETYYTEAYTLANVQLGRLAHREGDLPKALALFRKAQSEPDGFDAGWWDTQALYNARYHEAAVLDELGMVAERDEVIRSITNYVTSNYSPYMPPDRFYYIAAALRLGGDEIEARVLMSQKAHEWAQELESDDDRKLVQTALFISYVDDPALVHRASMLGALGYSRLFHGDNVAARHYFEQSLALDPDNLRVQLELKLI